MGKHRGGDPLKSLRFAHRALDLYSQGLMKYPRNFDLAYNKARLELEISTHPVLVKNLDVPIDEVLQKALDSHRYALEIDSENADLLFNMSQLLTTIAERIAEDEHKPDVEAIQYLEEALKYQSVCLETQKMKFSENREQIFEESFEDEDEDGGARLEMEAASNVQPAEQDEQWFSVVEPVTAETLLDTVLAQLETLTTLCNIVNASLPFHPEQFTDKVNPSQIESYSTKVLTGVLPDILRVGAAELQARETEIELTKANFIAAFLELTFRSRSISAQSYRENLLAVFSSHIFTSDPSALLVQARAFIAFDNAIVEVLIRNSTSSSFEQFEYGKSRWITLTEVQNLLTAASRIPTSEQTLIATTHGLRGDTSLLLFGLSHSPYDYPQAISNRTQLLQNAEVFYRNAVKLFDAQGMDWQDDKETYQFRGAIVQVLQQRASAGLGTPLSSSSSGESGQNKIDIQSIPLNALTKASVDWRREQLEDMIDDGLVDRESFAIT